MRGWKRLLAVCATVLLLAGCASTGGQMSAIQRAQYAWSAAIRWGEIDQAWALVDPAYRQAHPLDGLQRERFAQVQVSHYREQTSSTGEAQALREIEIGVVNRHTMVERTVRYTERWRYDEAAQAWWITDGLPDLWAGE